MPASALASATAPAVFAQGWAMGAGLILAIGAQNALVLRQGLRREHVGAVVAVCTLSAAFAFTYLNPHVYLDTVVLLGGLGARQPAELRAAFAAGAGLASAMWFGLLGFGAAAAAPRLRSARTWRAIDALVALLMAGLGLQLLLQPL